MYTSLLLTTCGNTAEAATYVYVYDNEAPVFTSVSGPVTIECNTDLPAGSATAVDNCDPEVTITVSEETEGDSSCLYYIIRTFTATDDCGNSALLLLSNHN
jgi:hypothetical protein